MTNLKYKKITYLIIGLLFIMILSVGIPSLGRFRNRITIDVNVWDGTKATSYKEGTGSIDDPYVISNGNELAYFVDSLKDTDYENTYFILSNDIILNKGTFSYNDNIIYSLEESYYINDNKYYETLEYTDEIGNINILGNIANFKGTLNGNSYTIYGLYLNQDNATFIDNLEGNISNLYIKNTLLKGKNASIIMNSNNSNIENILFEGYLIGSSDDIIKTESFTLDSINITDIETITIPHNLSNANISSIKLIGDYQLDNDAVIQINNNIIDNHFELDLDNDTFSLTSDIETNITFSNLTYTITYKDNISSIIGNSNNTIIKNIINKGTILSDNITSGIVGILYNSSLTNAYNKGIVENAITYKVLGESNITNVYNTHETCLINEVDGILNITNSFNIANVDVINKINDSTINVTSSYVIDPTLDITNSFTETTIDDLKDKEFLIDMYNEFISSSDLLENEDNVWIYIDDYPILYIDDMNSPVTLHVKNYTYDNYSDDLATFKFTDNITFSIEEDMINTTKYYYIHNSTTPLTKTELDNINTWIEYENIYTINEEGFYIIYVKVNNGVNDYYVNSDLLVLDLKGADANIKINDLNYNTLKSTLDNIYVNKAFSVTIDAIDEISGIKSIAYYIANDQIDELDNIEFNNYEEAITINEIGKYIVYAKVVDNSDYVTYVNTDYIIYNGYTLNITSGNHNNSDLNITDKSKMTLNFTYNGEEIIGNHNIVSNTLLPLGTIITIKENNKIYEYVVDDTVSYLESKAVYPFTLFKEKNKTNTYIENSVSNEDIDIIIDFKNTNILENIENIKVYLELDNMSTLEEDIIDFNVYVSNASVTLDLDNTPNIIYNSDSVTNINITSGIEYNYINQEKIYDSTYEDQKQGIAIRMLDSNHNILDSTYLKNMEFKIDNINYSPESDNIIRIPISDNIDSVTKTLSIITHSNSASLLGGTYYIEISNYTSYDGTYYDELNNQTLLNVVIVGYNDILDKYAFDVTISDDKRIIPKQVTPLDFYVTVSGITDADVRVSLYKKDELTAYNQDYSQIDLNNYVVEDLQAITDNIYYIEDSNFSINLNAQDLENNGYKFVFELYDGNKKISEISKYFIVR